jgi:hypothetical protein
VTIEDLLSGSPHLDQEERDLVKRELLVPQEVFSRGDDDIGLLQSAEHRIELLDSTPIYQKPRWFPSPVAGEIENQCAKLELLDVIEHSSSSWSSPVVPVRKKDGT